jgi:NADH-quinone oxidoreductase subunit E
MSVRRLAAEQPAGFTWSAKAEEEARWWLAKYPPDRKQSAVIPLLWLVQKQEGWVSEPAIRTLADMLGMPVIRVLEVATFYTMFHLAPVGKHHLQLCGTTPCALRGAEDLKAVCKKKIGAKFAVTSDGMLSWEEVECLGACVNAPVVAIDDLYHEDLSPDDLEKLIDALRRGEAVTPGSARGRQTSAPEGGAKTLTDPALYDGSLAKPVTLPNQPDERKLGGTLVE